MKISKRGEYALRALIDIGIAGKLEHDLVQIRELAEQEKNCRSSFLSRF